MTPLSAMDADTVAPGLRPGGRWGCRPAKVKC
jgi:hypothetical protein